MAFARSNRGRVAAVEGPPNHQQRARTSHAAQRRQMAPGRPGAEHSICRGCDPHAKQRSSAGSSFRTCHCATLAVTLRRTARARSPGAHTPRGVRRSEIACLPLPASLHRLRATTPASPRHQKIALRHLLRRRAPPFLCRERDVKGCVRSPTDAPRTPRHNATFASSPCRRVIGYSRASDS
jgi:hypothetical protein